MSEVARRWKRGEVHPETGLVFKQYDYRRGCREVWVTKQQFQHYIARERDHKKSEAGRAVQRAHSRRRRMKPAHREFMRQYLAGYRNRDGYKEKKRLYWRAWKREAMNDPVLRIKERMRTRLYQAIIRGGFTKKSETLRCLGCAWPDLKSHLEAKFQPGMTWENYGEWHIDHIIPLASAATADELHRLCHFSNLQPLWAQDNRAKSDSIPLFP